MRTLALSLSIIIFVGIARATIIYDTFGPDPYAPGVYVATVTWGNNVAAGSAGGTVFASDFTLTGGPYRLDSITLDFKLGDLERSPNLQIALYPDDNGHPSLNPILTLNPNPTFATDQRQIITYSFSNPGSILQSQIRYWLALQPASLNTTDETGNYIYHFSTSTVQPYPTLARRTYDSSAGGWGTWSTFPNTPSIVFRLDGSPVPEPSTWALLTLGSAFFWCAVRRRRK